MKELLLDETDEDEPREELEWTSLGFAGNELVPCDEMRAAPITISPTVMAQRTRKKFPAARPILVWPTSNLKATERLWFKAQKRG